MLDHFEEMLEEYARLLAEVGVNPQPGQTVMVSCPVDCAALGRKCVQALYDLGAGEVTMRWVDDEVTRMRYLRAREESFTTVPDWMAERYRWMAENNIGALHIIGEDPELLRGVDPARIQNWQKAIGAVTKEYRKAQDSNRFPWCIGAHPTPVWAKKVFPELDEATAMDKLWAAIFATCRVTGDGKAIQRWKTHIDQTNLRVEKLNGLALESLHYTNSLGTDLHIRLPKNHVWGGASDLCLSTNRLFVANIPTEEVFTAPHREGVNGRVYAALPLALNGNLVKDFWLELKDGKIVDLHAEEGEEYLRSAIAIDEGASYLGEVALVGYDSPINNTGVLFYNTLFDENASCHLAFGAAYSNCVRGAELLGEEEQKALGLNQSYTHEDFMVGTADLSIVGTTADGETVTIFRDGNWAF